MADSDSGCALVGCGIVGYFAFWAVVIVAATLLVKFVWTW
jgi:hypothetical protein